MIHELGFFIMLSELACWGLFPRGLFFSTDPVKTCIYRINELEPGVLSSCIKRS